MPSETFAVLSQIRSFFGWFGNLFNPPPLATMNRFQKVARSFFVTLVLVVTCTLVSMAVALGIFVIEKGHRILVSVPQLMNAVIIVLVSSCVNTTCVLILLRIRKADQQIISPPEDPVETEKKP